MAAAAAEKLPMIFDEFDLPSRDECTTTSFQDYIVILLLTLVLAYIYTVKLRKLIQKIYKILKTFWNKKAYEIFAQKSIITKVKSKV